MTATSSANWSSPAEVFDSIAPDYDRIFTDSLVGRAQRDAVWEVLDRTFLPGQSVLELNCGTGEDACHLAARGVRVHGCDASPEMIRVARRRAAPRISFEVREIEEIASLHATYDGVLSNFGGLNCVDDLQQMARELPARVRSGGALVLCFMGPLCAWETVWYLAQGDPRKAARRWKRRSVAAHVGKAQLQIHYPAVREVVRLLSPEFRLVEWKGVGVLVPPSYVEPLGRRHENALRWAKHLDRRIAHWPLLRGVADHQLLRFERVTL